MKKYIFGYLTVIAILSTAVYANDTPIRVRDARQMVEQTVTVSGRTGVRVESMSSGTSHVYTLRDDYGDAINIRSGKNYPVMGVTLVVKGKVKKEGNDVIIDEISRRDAFSSVPKWMFLALAGLVLAGIAFVWYIIRRRMTTTSLPPAWGYAAVTNGPDQGKNFALRGDRIIVGRGQDPSTSVSFELDTNVSRTHGAIIHQGQQVYYEDTNSRNGSWVGTQQVAAGQRVPITPGTLIRLGTTTILRIEPIGGGQVGTQTVMVGAAGQSEDSTRRAQ